MKLTKNELKDCLNSRIKWHRYAEFLRSQGFSGKKNDDFYERYEALLNKLEDDTIEIEGYIRADHFDDAEEKVWTRYIPNKPHTHPESGEFVLTCMKGDMEVVEFKAGAGFYFYNEELGWTFVDDPYFPLFWRHLPQPPKELKESPRCRPLPKPPVETENN